MMKPRVLHVAETLPGGVATVLQTLMADQTGRWGVSRVSALVPDAPADHLTVSSPSQKRTYLRKGRNFWALAQLAWELGMTVWHEKPDVVHLHSTFAGAIGRVVLLGLKPWRKPVIVYCPHAFSFLMDTTPFRQSLFAFAEYLLSFIADAIVCVSQYEQLMAEQFGLSPRNLIVIRNGVAPVQPKGRNPFRMAKNALKLLFVGRFDRQKGFDLLQKVMAKLENDNVHLIAVGAPVQSQLYPPAAPNITFTGWLPSEQVAACIYYADVIVMPSRYEGLGLVMLEAMRQGKPLLASDIGPLVEGGSGAGIFIRPENTNAWVKALQNTSKAEWRRLGQAGREIYQREFTAARMCRETVALYQDLLTK